ncbi:tRNA-dihydrouridine synthase [Encephalitozoon hellem]|uniref:tRNA-dihydrouridine synthase n=1 Tax=Encephalitozoon hellem TaxID=27973 RepID=A0ABY8CJH1_ENCHE|nr:tRNA-dihydrouridine synthase [Encephalitozoon hellem]
MEQHGEVEQEDMIGSESSPMEKKIEISLAPMMDVTTPHFRRFIRLTSETTVLFTEMIVSNTVIHIPRDKLKEKLGEYDDNTVVQIGGSDAMQIVEAVRILQGFGYKMFNLNCGCPSSRVKKGSFGAVLMLDRRLVSEIINRVYEETGVILSLKIRTGVDDHDGMDFLKEFVSYIKENTPNRTFYIHARKCWLEGLSPEQNRKLPPLDYGSVYEIKKLYPELKIVLNGSIGGDNLDKIDGLDGAMIGREAIRNVFVFWDIDQRLSRQYGGEEECILDADTRGGECNGDHESKRAQKIRSVVKQYFEGLAPSTRLRSVHILPIMNLMKGKRGCKEYRRKLNLILSQQMRPSEVYPLIMKHFE